jgi:hypothetical protein
MGNCYRLVALKNSELLAGLSELVQRSNAITAEELAHLAELEDRMLHLELGFPSLFAYCVEALGMSEGAAGRRVAAARVCRRFPEVFERVARGDLHLSALCALSTHLNPANASELFEACRRRTRRQIDELLAARFPRPDVREQIRRLPVRGHEAAGGGKIVPDHSGDSSEALHEPARRIDIRPHFEAPRRRELEALSADRFGVRFSADAELCELIERARALASHRLPKRDLASLMRLVLETFVQHEEKRRFAVGRKPRAAPADGKPAGTSATTPAQASALPTGARSTPPGEASALPTRTPSTPPGEASALPTGTSSASPGEASAQPASPRRKVTRPARFRRVRKWSRYLSARVTRSVYLRDHGQCSFVSADGRRCGARAFLQLDHIQPWAALGASVTENIRILCRGHNQLHARNCFGARHIAAKIAARRADERTEI